MNEALKLTRHLPASASSPLSRLLTSKGSLEWEKSIKAKQDVILDTAHVGWRVLEREDRLNALEESKQRKATSGLLSFWNRRASAIQAAPVEPLSERSSPPARLSLESIKPVPYPPSSRAASPPKALTTSVPPPTDSQPPVITIAPAPSAVSRFLSRFSRTKGPQHSSLALSSDDLEFLSDIVPSASDPPDEDSNDDALSALTGASNPSPLPPKLPPPIPPPPKQPILSSHSSSVPGLGSLDGVSVIANAHTAFQKQTANRAPDVPVLAPPLSPEPAGSFSRAQSPPLSLKGMAPGQSSTPSVRQTFQSSSRPSSQLLPPRKIPPLLSIPPLLPPPPVSPPQTPRPSILSSSTPAHPSTMQSANISPLYDSDEEFSAFTSFPPPVPSPFPSSEPYPSQGPPSPPSPPPRRSYERTHYPTSSSTSSILSPASRTSLDQLCSTRSSIPASLDSFDDFVSPPPVARGENRKPTALPPTLPIKPHLQPLHLDTFSSRVYHARTPSQTFASPTVRTSLLNGPSSVPSVSRAEHQRTQSLVNHAAARGGTLWPNSPDMKASSVKPIPPPSAPASPNSLIGYEGFDLLGDDTLGGSLEVLPVSLDTKMGVANGTGKGLGWRNQLQPSPPPLPSTSATILSFPSPVPFTATNPGSLQPSKPKQTGGLSAQDLLFFEGL